MLSQTLFLTFCVQVVRIQVEEFAYSCGLCDVQSIALAALGRSLQPYNLFARPVEHLTVDDANELC